MKARSLALGALLVTACASLPEYQPPAAGALRARLTLEAREMEGGGFFFWKDGVNCLSPQLLPRAFWGGQAVEIEAGREVAVGLMSIVAMGAASSTTCVTQIISFTPSANVDYKLKFVADRAAKVCRMSLVRADRGFEDPEPSARPRQPTNASSPDRPGCT